MKCDACAWGDHKLCFERDCDCGHRGEEEDFEIHNVHGDGDL